MQIILTEEEYNKLLQKAGQVEAQVEFRLEEEKKRFFEHLTMRITSDKLRSPEDILRMVIDLLKSHT